MRRDLSRYVFVKKCAIRIDKKQKERYGKKYCHHSPSIEESLLQDAVMRAIMQTAKQNVEVLKTLKIHIGMGLRMKSPRIRRSTFRYALPKSTPSFRNCSKRYLPTMQTV